MWSRRQVGPERHQSRRKPRRGRLLLRHRGRRARSGAPRLARHRRIALSQERNRVRLGARDALGHADPGRSAGEAHRARPLLQREPADPSAGSARPGGRLVSARPETTCRSIIGTKKRAVSITPAITTCAIARPEPTSMSASAGASPSLRFDCSDAEITVF